MIFLNGAILISLKDGGSEQVPVHFVLVNGFPGIAPKVFLTKPPDKKLIKENPFIMDGNEVMNQFLDKWQGYNPNYTIAQAFYYVYQSFLHSPPVGSGISVQEEEEMPMEDHRPSVSSSQHEDVGEDDDEAMNKLLLQSKVEEKLKTYYTSIQKSLNKVAPAQVKMDQNSGLINKSTDELQVKNALLQSGIETLKSDISDLEEFC